jgi:predicted phosphodiesterase
VTRGPSVFAVEDTSAQVSWRGGVIDVSGLTPATTARVHVDLDGTGADVAITTLAPPPGRELTRIATVNDVHIGQGRFGLFDSMHEPPNEVPHAVRCLQSAVRDALAWGAQLIVVKGDLTERSRPAEWELVGEVLGHLPVPIAVVPGNHEVSRSRPTDAQPALARQGLHLVHGVEVIDLPGLRLILVDSTLTDHRHGRIGHLQDVIVRRAARAPGTVLVAMHHNLQRTPRPRYWPPGIPAPESRQFLRALRAANPRSLVTTGHTHRHRRHDWDGVTWTEIGSTKDFPGTWAGYVAHAGGIRQVVRRVSDPSVLPWLDATRKAYLRVWGHWSPGKLDDRCFTIAWPDPLRPAPGRPPGV